MARTKDILPEKVKHKRREMRRARLMLVILIVLVLLGAAIGLSHWSAVTISSVTVAGNTVTPTFEVEQIANEAMDDSYLFVFPKRMVVLSPKSAIEQRILGKWPRIKSVEVRADSFTSLHIQIEERVAEYTWCGDKKDFMAEVGRMHNDTSSAANATSATCFYLDSNGLAFSEAPDISGEVYFKLYGGDFINTWQGEKADSLLRHSFASSTRFAAMNNFLDALRGAKFTPTHLFLNYNGDAEALLSPSAAQVAGARILFNVDQDLDKALEAVRIALGQASQTGQASAEVKEKDKSAIDYIDVRYSNKVYLKRR